MAEKKIDSSVLFKEQIAKLLRSADEFTRENRFDDAILELERVLRLDPKNNYARSFLERVRYLQKRADQRGRSQAHEAELSLEERMTKISRHLTAAEEYVKQRSYRQALAEIAEVYRIDQNNYYARAFSERIEMLMEQEKLQIDRAAKVSTAPPVIVASRTIPGMDRGVMVLYHELLREMWLDGQISPEEERELHHVCEIFGISEEQHGAIEREVKIEAYVDALRIAWRDNVLTETERSILLSLREKYNITGEVVGDAENRFESTKRMIRSKGTILVVDPDREALVTLSKKLKNRGYLMYMAQRIEDAWQILNTQTPSIIISEALFPNQTMDGFGFYQKLHEHPVLRRVPFFCITSVADPKIIRAGLRLGIDYFVAKPVDFETLTAAIEGRLRE
jgi:CheY-like chemotaxis protein